MLLLLEVLQVVLREEDDGIFALVRRRVFVTAEELGESRRRLGLHLADARQVVGGLRDVLLRQRLVLDCAHEIITIELAKLQQVLHILVGEHHFLVLEAERALDELHFGHQVELHEVQRVAKFGFVDGTSDDGILDGHFCDFYVV